jgi:cytochrome c peroxidase
VRALVAYVSSLAPPPQGPTSNAALVARGEALFRSDEVACASCHVPGAFTDGQAHDVGSAGAADRARAFDTPSLRHLAGRGPFFHDGRYPTLRALLTDATSQMGRTRQLGPDDLDALEAYLRSL